MLMRCKAEGGGAGSGQLSKTSPVGISNVESCGSSDKIHLNIKMNEGEGIREGHHSPPLCDAVSSW
jgi:hypothetical protein